MSKVFGGGRDLFGRKRPFVRAVHRVSLAIRRGESVGLVGESGCGKSTLARLILGLEPPTVGAVRWSAAPDAPGKGSAPRHSTRRAERRAFRRRVQLVFQDPRRSLNPRKTVRQILSAPLEALTDLDEAGRERRARELLDLVELSHDALSRYAHEFSGGQAQRIGLARALAPEPDLLVLDEATSSLDVSIQARILRLLHDLKKRLDVAYLFIAHDLSVVEVLCERVAVMYLGGIAELGSAEQVLQAPKHPYTRSLLSAVPVLGQRRRRIVLEGEPPSPAAPPSGCSFHPRCYRAEAVCSEKEPELGDGDVDRPCACFFANDSEPHLGRSTGADLGVIRPC